MARPAKTTTLFQTTPASDEIVELEATAVSTRMATIDGVRGERRTAERELHGTREDAREALIARVTGAMVAERARHKAEMARLRERMAGLRRKRAAKATA